MCESKMLLTIAPTITEVIRYYQKRSSAKQGRIITITRYYEGRCSTSWQARSVNEMNGYPEQQNEMRTGTVSTDMGKLGGQQTDCKI
jgi:hypothetical protein